VLQLPNGEDTRNPQFMSTPPVGAMRGPVEHTSPRMPRHERQARGPIISPDERRAIARGRSRGASRGPVGTSCARWIG
jgi:hypothetical protein